MSFILDALKKADAERHLGQMPGIHTQQLPVSGSVGHATPPRMKTVLVLVIGGAFALAAGTLLWQSATEEAAAPAASPGSPQIAAVPPPVATAPAPISAPPPAPAPAEPQKSAPPVREPIMATEIPVPPPLPAPVARREPAPPAKEPATRSPATSGVATGETAGANASAKTAAPQARIMSISELPADVQRELPPFAVKGSMYSDNPANRMLLLDKRLLHEGDEIAPGLVLETLMPKAATLRYKQYRFQITY